MARSKDPYKTESIFNATLSLIMRNGYAQMNIADVAKEAQVATGTLYNYFEDKADLINKLFLHLKGEKMSQMMAEHDPDESFYSTFKRLWKTYICLSYKEHHKMLFIEQYVYSPLLSKATRQESESILAPVLKLLSDAQKSDIIKAIQPEVMLFHITGAALEVVKYHINNNLKLTDEIIENCFDMTWSGIRK